MGNNIYTDQLQIEIKKKFGEEAVKHPLEEWNDEKEVEYIKDAEERRKKFTNYHRSTEKVDNDGILVSKRLINKEKEERVCPVCSTFSFDFRDSVYMNKFQCCRMCYIEYVEGREKRWESGWRP